MDKKSAAKALFDAGWKQNDIAATLGVTIHTISQYVVKGKWKEKRTEKNTVFATNKERAARLNSYQLSVLERIVDIREKDLENKELTVKELEALLISRGEIDALQKMFVVLKDREFGFDKMVICIREFMEYIQIQAPDLAKKLLPIAQDYIENQRKEA